MKANYHAHTWRCKHAEGTEKEYVEAAIAHGFDIYGFSDHTPYPALAGEKAGIVRMQPEQLEDYVDTVLALRDEYKDDIEIHLGLEAEYYPAYWEDLMKLIEPYPIEYLLLGQHFIGLEDVTHEKSGRPTEDEAALARYVAQVEEGLSTGKYTYLAHPDLLNYVGPAEIFDRHYRGLVRFCKDRKIPLEINMLGLWKGRNYPNRAFWKIAGEEQAPCIIGMDTHIPDNVYQEREVAIAHEWVREFHLPLMETVELVKPF